MMKDKTVDELVGKWCLWDKYCTGDYIKLFINNVQNDLVEYSYDKKSWNYADVCKFEHGYLVECPFKEISSRPDTSQMVTSHCFTTSLPI